MTKTTFLLTLRVPAVTTDEVYMCKALFSLQLNNYRTTIVKNSKSKSKLRVPQKSQRGSIYLPLTNSTNKRKKAVFKTPLETSTAEFWAGHSAFPHDHPDSRVQLPGSCPEKVFFGEQHLEYAVGARIPYKDGNPEVKQFFY